MGMFSFVQPQRSGQRVDRGDGRADCSSLFQPDVPVDPDTGAFGHFLTSQTRGSTPAADGQANRMRDQFFPS
jgi:hypothetical protein